MATWTVRDEGIIYLCAKMVEQLISSNLAELTQNDPLTI